MKIMPPGPAGRSSPEGSQVSLLFINEPKHAAGLESFTDNWFVTIQFKLDAIKYKTRLPLCGSINFANWFTEVNKQSQGYLAKDRKFGSGGLNVGCCGKTIPSWDAHFNNSWVDIVGYIIIQNKDIL